METGTINQRLKTALDYLKENNGLTAKELQQKIKIEKSQYYKIQQEGATVKERWIKSIADSFPIINDQWLLTGEGKMLKKSKATVYPFMTKHEQLILKQYRRLVPQNQEMADVFLKSLLEGQKDDD